MSQQFPSEHQPERNETQIHPKIKTESFCASKDSIKIVENATECKNIFSKHVSVKGVWFLEYRNDSYNSIRRR